MAVQSATHELVQDGARSEASFENWSLGARAGVRGLLDAGEESS